MIDPYTRPSALRARCAFGAAPSLLITPFVLVTALLALAPIASYQERRDMVSGMWRLTCLVLPLTFLVDDVLRTPEQVDQRSREWASDPLQPLQTTLIFLVLGIFHGRFAPLAYLVAFAVLITIRQAHLVLVLAELARPAYGLLVVIAPLALGHMMSDELVARTSHMMTHRCSHTRTKLSRMLALLPSTLYPLPVMSNGLVARTAQLRCSLRCSSCGHADSTEVETYTSSHP